MKKMKLFVAIAALVLTTVSCVESSSKYKTLLSERNALQEQNQMLDANYNETLAIINDVEESFAAIRQSEGALASQMKSIEGQSSSKKQQFGTQLEQIKQLWKDNKEKIAHLQQRLSKSGKENASLVNTVKRLETELTDKANTITAMQEELTKKNVQIEGLTATVNDLNTNITQLNETSSQQQATINQQDADMHSAWYYIGTSKELKAGKIVTSNGLFQAKSVLGKDFDKSLFTKVDLRSLTSIPTNSKRIKLLSTHPEGSYKLTTGADKMITLEIADATNFWSVSKYLVIQK